ncbi:MAG: response regulator, partial [Gemmatimonadota bacterium]
GGTALNITHPDDMPAAKDFLAQLRSGPGAIARAELRARHRDGSYRTLRIVGQNLLDNPAVRGIVITAQDETDRRRLELQFQQAQKMEAIGNLAGGVAHDFNNLLTVIIGNVEMMTSEQPDQANPALCEIRDAANRAAALTRQLLAFSRRQVLQPRVVNINEILTGMQQMLARLLGEHIVVRIQLKQELRDVNADPGQIEQAVMNLAVNARDAMPSGGSLTFETRNVSAYDAPLASHDPIPAGEYACLVVCDTGVGMSNETMGRVFEPFFTTKDVGKGTGLGLATVYGIMKQSGGYASVTSEPGHGTTFRLYFPPATGSAASLHAGKESSRSTAGSETILVVEDEPAVRGLVKRVLQDSGYRVLDSADAKDAFRKAHEHDGPIHLLLSDVVLPDLSGREVADRIAMIRPGIRIAFMSGYTPDEVIHRGVFSDAINFLQKPFTPATLLEAVRSALEQS